MLIENIIPILDGSENMEFLRSFGYFNIGQRFILKAHFENRMDHEFDLEGTPLANFKTNGPQVLVLSICLENVIVVIGEIATGKLTKPIEQIVSLNQALRTIGKRTRFS